MLVNEKGDIDDSTSQVELILGQQGNIEAIKTKLVNEPRCDVRPRDSRIANLRTDNMAKSTM